MTILRIFVLSAIVLLSDFYLFHPSIRLPTLAMMLLVGTCLFRRGLPQFKYFGGNLLRQLLLIGFSFNLYLAIVDLSRESSVYDVSVRFISTSMVMLLPTTFIERRRPFQLVIWFIGFSFVSFIFAAIQVAGIHVSLADVVPNFGVLGSDMAREELIDRYGRATGATSNTIAFALQMAIVILLAYSGWFVRTSTNNIQLGGLGILGLLFSQTRAALFGVVPAVVLSHLYFARARLRTLLPIIPVVVIGLGVAWGVQQTAVEYFPYIAKEINTGDTHRLWTNWFMSVGVFHESPWFGISPKEAWEVCFRYADMKLVLYGPDMPTPTHHNQLGFYFRYYGFIGLFFLFAMYLKIFQIIKLSPSIPVRIFLGSLFILDLMYSMTHNNKLLSSPVLWVFLSMAFLPLDRANRMLEIKISLPRVCR